MPRGNADRPVGLWIVALAMCFLVAELAKPGRRQAAELDVYGSIQMAAADDDVAMLRWIWITHPECDWRTDESRTYLGATLRLGASRGYIEMVRLLLSWGADPNARSLVGKTALMDAAGCPQSVAVAKLLIVRGADINASDRHGRTAMMEAIDQDDQGLVRELSAPR
jgi:Ankyrin repeats (3 copies)